MLGAGQYSNVVALEMFDGEQRREPFVDCYRLPPTDIRQSGSDQLVSCEQRGPSHRSGHQSAPSSHARSDRSSRRSRHDTADAVSAIKSGYTPLAFSTGATWTFPVLAFRRMDCEDLRSELLIEGDLVHFDDPVRCPCQACLGPKQHPSLGVDG